MGLPSTAPARTHAAVARFFLPALAVMLAAFALRVIHLDAQSLWFDEGWSWHLARLPMAAMAETTAGDRSPFLYYLVLNVWLRLAGESEFAMRFLSVCADTSAVALVIALSQSLSRALSRAPARRNASLSPAIFAGLLAAFNPLAVWYAQETRMYALMAALCLASSYWLWRWLRTPGRRAGLVASAGLLAAAAYCHYYAVFLLPAQGIVVLLACLCGRRDAGSTSASRLIARWRDLAAWLVAAAGIAVVLAPWLVFASRGFAYDDGFVFPLNTVGGRLGEWVMAFAGGGLPRSLPEAWPALLGVAVLAGALSFVLQRRWWELACLLALIAVPLLSATLAVRLFFPYRSVFHPRYLIYVSPLVCVLLAGAGGRQKDEGRRMKDEGRRMKDEGRRMKDETSAFILHPSSFILLPSSFLLIAILWLPSVWAIYTDPAVARDDVRGATRHVVEALQPGDLVIMTRDNYALRYYYPRLAAQHPVTGTTMMAVPEGLHGVLADDTTVVSALARLRPNRVRLVLWQDDVVDPQKLVESSLWPYGYQIGEYNYGRIRLPLYQMRNLPVGGLPWSQAQATFGGKLDLTGYWMPDTSTAGDWFYVVLRWQPRERLDEDYKVFVHIVDDNNQVRFQRDRQPLNDLLPMTRWHTGQAVRDSYAVVTPPDLPPGEYRVLVGVYGPHPGDSRLLVQSDAALPSHDTIELGKLRMISR